MRNRIAELILAHALRDPAVVFLTGDLGYSVVEPLQAQLGERFLNMGVAEANMIGVAASLADSGFTPFAYSIAPFATARCYEQIRNDIAYHRRRARIIGVGAGFSYGTLGPSHHALEDAHLMAALPDVIVANPWNVAELDRIYALLEDDDSPAYLRLARESGAAGAADFDSLQTAAYIVRDGGDLTLVASGVSVTQALEAADLLARRGLSARVVSVPILAPFPARRVAALLGDGPVATVFEGYPGHPLAQGVMALLLDQPERRAFLDCCAPHRFAPVVGDTGFQRRAAGLDGETLAARCIELAAPGLAVAAG